MNTKNIPYSLSNTKLPPVTALEIISLKKLHGIPLKDILSSHEKYIYTRLSTTKQVNWLVGRFAAKREIAEQIQKKWNYVFELSDIEITTEVLARPTFRIPKLRKINPKLAIRIERDVVFSLAHSNGFATAQALCDRKSAVGVDIEKVRSFSQEALFGFLTSNECMLYKRLSVDKQKIYTTLLWCLKEAYLKAIGVGLTVHPKRIEIRINQASRMLDIFEDGELKKASSKWTLTQKQCIVTNVYINRTQ